MQVWRPRCPDDGAAPPTARYRGNRLPVLPSSHLEPRLHPPRTLGILVATALALACTPSIPDITKVAGGSDSAADTDTVDTGPEIIGGHDSDSGEPDDSAGPDDSGDTGDQVETWPKDCSPLYDQDELQTFDLTFTDADWSALQNDCYSGTQSYHPVDLTWNGETVPAKVRLKGNWTWNCGKLQFVVSFNEDDSAGRFHGVRKMVLDAPWYDRTMLHERLAFPLFKRLDLPYSCVNSAKVSVNGDYYGLYSNIERLDHEYLERNFEDPSGNLYQAGNELKTNEDAPDTSDLDALRAASTVEEIAAVVDLNEATAEWAAEAMIPALDNYWAGVEINYYLYDYPGRGFLYLPYDLDLVFGDSVYGDGTPIWGNVDVADPIKWQHTGWLKEQLFETVLSDPEWCETYVDNLVLARAAYNPADMVADIEEWDAQIYEAYAADPRATVDITTHEASIALLEVFIQDRADAVDAWLADGGHCPATW